MPFLEEDFSSDHKARPEVAPRLPSPATLVRPGLIQISFVHSIRMAEEFRLESEIQK